MLIFIAVWTFVQLHEQTEDRQVLRYVYYFLARLLVESGTQLTAEATNPNPAGILVPFLDQQECFLIYNS
jgi:hypothetical protein